MAVLQIRVDFKKPDSVCRPVWPAEENRGSPGLVGTVANGSYYLIRNNNILNKNEISSINPISVEKVKM